MTRQPRPRTLVLASGSAGRLRVLRDAGFAPEVQVSGVDESTDNGLDTAAVVSVLAERKAAAVAGQRPDALVLGCDTLLDFEQTAFGKPASAGALLIIGGAGNNRGAMLGALQVQDEMHLSFRLVAHPRPGPTRK